MRGMLRSKRCQRCRRRKIKCDENWPDCTQCVRANATCSGPPPGTRLAASRRGCTHSASSSTSSCSAAHASLVAVSSPPESRATIAHDHAPSCTSPSSYDRLPEAEAAYSPNSCSPDSASGFYAEEPGLRLEPTTTAERVAARLVGYLEKGSCYDASLAACYLHLLPARLGESAALRDAVALFCSCWGSFRRAVPAERLVDPKAYGKALRSLQRALDDPRHQLSVETLAATSVMDRVEILFDSRKRRGHATHAKGISVLMAKRGPPKADDELDIHLTLGNQGTLLWCWLLQGGSNFLLTAPWREALALALADGNTNAPSQLIEAYKLDAELGCWPSIIREVKDLRDLSHDDPERTPRAIELRERATRYAKTIEKIGDEFRRSALSSGAAVETVDKDSPVGRRYSFEAGGWATLHRWMMYATDGLMLNRLCATLADAEGVPRAAIDANHRMHCREVWMCLPWMRGLGPISGVVFATPLTLAAEGGDVVEKTYLLDTVLELDRYKGRFPKERGPLEELMAFSARTITGRGGRFDVGRFSLSI